MSMYSYQDTQHKVYGENQRCAEQGMVGERYIIDDLDKCGYFC